MPCAGNECHLLIHEVDAFCAAPIPLQAPPQPFSPDKWEPSHPHMAMYQALLDMVGKHEWSQEEQETLLKFRARFGEPA